MIQTLAHSRGPLVPRLPRALLPLATLLLNALTLATHAELVELRPILVEKDGSIGVEYHSGGTLVGPSTGAAPAGVQLLLPGAEPKPVVFRAKTGREGVIELGPARIGALKGEPK